MLTIIILNVNFEFDLQNCNLASPQSCNLRKINLSLKICSVLKLVHYVIPSYSSCIALTALGCVEFVFILFPHDNSTQRSRCHSSTLSSLSPVPLSSAALSNPSSRCPQSVVAQAAALIYYTYFILCPGSYPVPACVVRVAAGCARESLVKCSFIDFYKLLSVLDAVRFVYRGGGYRLYYYVGVGSTLNIFFLL